jgi:hypothetical protein
MSILVLREPNRLLTYCSTSVASTTGWDFDPAKKYFWLSNDHVAFYSLYQHDWEIFDLKTQKEKTLVALSGRLKNLIGDSPELQLSPDQKWVLYSNYIKDFIIIVRRNNPASFHVARTTGEIGWLADSQHWVECNVEDTQGNCSSLRLHNLKRPDATYVIPVAPPSQLSLGSCLIRQNNHFFTWRWLQSIGNHPSIQITESSLDNKVAPVKHYLINLPRDAKITGNDAVVFSPDGDRIAWQFQFSHTTIFASLLQSLLGLHSEPYTTAELWVSKLDGSDMHQIGYQRVDSYSTLDDDSPFGVAWLPDGKHLSFVYRNVLRVVPTD